MSVEREPQKDPTKLTRDRLLRDLNTVPGTNLGRAISEASEYLHHYPHDEVVSKALAHAERRLQESNTAG